MSLNSLFRRIFKQDIKWGTGTTQVIDNEGNPTTVDEVNASDVPVKDNILTAIDDNVDDVLVSIVNDIDAIDTDLTNKVDVNETRDVTNTGVSTLGDVAITNSFSLGDNIASDMADGVNPTDGVNKSQLDTVSDTIITEHNSLDGLDVGNYKHLSEVERTQLVTGIETNLHSHEVDYDDLTNKLTAGTGIDLTNNEITNTKISENNVVSKLIQYSVGSEAADPTIGTMTISVLSDGRLKVKIYPDVDGMIYDRKRDCTIRFRNEDRTSLDGIVEMYILEDSVKTNDFYTYIAYNTLWTTTNDMVALAGLQQTFSIVFDNNLVTDFAKDTATITVTDPLSESISGSAETQQVVNQQFKTAIEAGTATDMSEIVQEHTGFQYGDDISVTYNQTNRTIQLVGNTDAYYQNELIVSMINGWTSPAHPDNVTAPQFLYYNGIDFVWSETPWDFYDLMIAIVIFNSNGDFVGGLRETHGFMDWESHHEFHQTVGTYIEGGQDVTNVVLDSTTEIDRRPFISNTVLHDEDVHTTNYEFVGGNYSQLTFNGTGQANILSSSDIVPLNVEIPYYNKVDAGTYTQAPLTDGEFMNVWLLNIPSTNDTLSQDRRFLMVQGQMTHTTQATAELENISDIDLGEFGGEVAEFVFSQRITIKYETLVGWTITNIKSVNGSKVSQLNNTQDAPESAGVLITNTPTESFSGNSQTQNVVNEEVVDNLNNIYDLVLGQSPAYGDLIGDPLPQAIASNETLATWSTVNQSSNTDVWEFTDVDNEILIKKAGFYTWNTQVSLTNSSNQNRFLIFSTRNKNNPTEYYYTRSILVPRNGVSSQSSIQFEIPDDNTTIEILAHGETSNGNGSNSLTLNEWNTSLTLNFVLLPEFDLATDNIEVSSPTLESINGAGGATKQSGINAENKGAIESNQSGINFNASNIYDLDLKVTDNEGKVSISAGDTSNLFLEDKLIAGDNITLAKTNNQGGEEYIVINSTAVNPETTDLDYAKLNKDPNSITETTTTDDFYTNLLINGDVDVSDATRINITSNGIINNPSLGSDTVKVLINYSFNIRAFKDQTTYGEQFPCYVKFGDGANTYVGNEFYGIKATAVNLQDSESWTTVSGSSVVDLVGGGEDWYWQVRSSLTAGGTIQVRDSSISVTEIGTSVTTGGTGVDENVKASDTDTTAGKLIDKLAEGSNVTLSIQNEGGDEKILITSSGEVSTIVKQGVNYYNLGSDICNNTNGTGQEIGNISSVYNNGTGWLMKSANGNVLTDIPTVANVTYADGLSPAIPILDNTKAIQMKLRTGNCRVFDTNRNDKTGIAYVEINIFELDSQSIISTNHSLVQTVQLMDSFGANNASVVGKGQTSNNYVTFELTNLNGIFTLDSAKQYGFTISGTNDQNAPKSVEKIMLMDTALLTVVYEGEVL